MKLGIILQLYCLKKYFLNLDFIFCSFWKQLTNKSTIQLTIQLLDKNTDKKKNVPFQKKVKKGHLELYQSTCVL